MINNKINADSEYELKSLPISKANFQTYISLFKNSQKKAKDILDLSNSDGLVISEDSITMVIDCQKDWKSKKPYFLKLHNLSNSSIAYHVKLTDTSRYFLQDGIGLIEPKGKKNVILAALLDPKTDLNSITDKVAVFWKKTDIGASKLNEEHIKKMLKEGKVERKKLDIKIEDFKNVSETKFFTKKSEACQNIYESMCQSHINCKKVNSDCKNSIASNKILADSNLKKSPFLIQNTAKKENSYNNQESFVKKSP